MKSSPLIVIVGTTASGKSTLAIELAKKFNGEIVCADSRTVYKGMDIGTAKPTQDDQALVPHHLLDVVTPNKRFGAADFKKLAVQAIEDISKRGKLPILVGGSGLYIDSVVYDFSFRESGDPKERSRLEALSVSQLQAELRSAGIPLPNNPSNPRHLVRAIETKGEVPVRNPLRPHTLVLGLRMEKKALIGRIRKRVEAMVEAGLIDEARGLVAEYGHSAPALGAPGYKPITEYLNGTISLEEAKTQFIKNDMNLAKRQLTWFRRNKSIHWLEEQGEAVELVTTFLNKTAA